MPSRRAFNQAALSFALGWIPATFLSQCRQSSTVSDAPASPSLPSPSPILKPVVAATPTQPEVELLVPTFLGNEQRRFYGRGQPEGLRVLQRWELGSGQTYFKGYATWSGAGWTGQPTLVRDRGKTYLTIGAFDHGLHKIDLVTGQQVWRYAFDDVIKGTATIYIDQKAKPENQIVILQGSRQGLNNTVSSSGPVPSLRAISFRTGQELWRLDIRQTSSWSRDNDSSPLVLSSDLLFNVGENGIGYFLPSNAQKTWKKQGIRQPQILKEVALYGARDRERQGGNLVAESSPSQLGDRIYIAAGSGHIYGFSIPERRLVWDFFIGSDLDGSVVISKDSKLFCAIEKQYIPGSGGILKLNPAQAPGQSVEWFLPTGDRGFASWEGGVISSVALNDEYHQGEVPALFATTAIDGNLYVGSQTHTTGHKVKGPRLDHDYDTPYIAFRYPIGASISTPIFTDGHRLVAAGYNGVFLFQIHYEPAPLDSPYFLTNARGEKFRVRIETIAQFGAGLSFEATPVVWEDRVYIACRDGYLYALG